MIIKNVVNRALTDGELASMNRFRSYTDGVSFACLAERVMVMLYDAEGVEIEHLVECAAEHVEETLSRMRDFSVYEMDDGHVMLSVGDGIFVFTEEPVEGDMGVYMCLREEAYAACEVGDVLAVAYEMKEV